MLYPPPSFRVCSECRISLRLTREHFRSKGGDKLSARCKSCDKNHPDKRTLTSRSAPSADTQERRREYRKRWCAKNPDYYRNATRAWVAKNRDRHRELMRNYQRERRHSDPEFRIRGNFRNAINKMLRGKKKSQRTEDLLGYSIEELRTHLERQFAKGMSWDNHGKSGWHVDHIIPISSFKIEAIGDAEFKACWSLTNLRPLWWSDNVRKHNQRTHLL